MKSFSTESVAPRADIMDSFGILK